MTTTNIHVGALAWALTLCACASSGSGEQRVPDDGAARSLAPIATDPAIDTIWGYLAGRYDVDGDGVLTAAEYDRGSEQFAEWDRDESGTLTEADFEGATRGGRARAGAQARGSERMDRGGTSGNTMGKTRRMLARYFQDDEEVGLLPLEEAQRAFERYDGSDGSEADGQVSEDEFTCAMQERHMAVPGDEMELVQRVIGDATPWELLLEGLDEDASGTLGAGELAAFYRQVLETDTIDYRGWGSGAGRAGGRGGARRRAGAGDRDFGDRDFGGRGAGGRDFGGRGAGDRGARERGAGRAAAIAEEGVRAPDFTLRSPDGQTTVTLSQHAGSRPVALIFGSYT